ncbi:hypothetical protein SCHPADRAFT_911642 [Schizopora paradoxa]|uniref:Uncharacterized protein n=1 Tax=Schizopora paradoxa TaxID=27342 RepID=A0A0H2R4V0_9AGAM|nr:hypothetical protein SCHPADRAFT_911642 [Schizopora paradoxa]
MTDLNEEVLINHERTEIKSPLRKKKRMNRKRKRTPEVRHAYNAKHDQFRRDASHRQKKSQQVKNAEKKMGRNDIGSSPSIFQTASVVETNLNPDSIRRQKPSFLSIDVSKDKPTPGEMYSLESNQCGAPKSRLTAHRPLSSQLDKKIIPGIHPDCDPQIADLIAEKGYTYIANAEGRAQILADKNGTIFFVKAERPAGWDEIAHRVHLIIKEIRKKISNTEEQHRPAATSNRHKFPSDCLQIMFGLIFPHAGQGPHCQNVDPFFQPILEELLENAWMQKYINYITGCFRAWFRRHAFVYEEVMRRLGVGSDVKANIFKNSLFCGTTFNLGPVGVTVRHRDSRNLVGGLCMIGVLGDFDHRTSGHFIMEEAKTIMELRSGDVVFMPSAGITHMNAGLRSGESRASIVQYTSGDLFRWIWQGKKMLPENEAKLKAGIRAAEGSKRWEEMYSFFPTLMELEEVKDRGDGLLGFQDGLLKENILSGKSLLFPSETRLEL